MRGKLNGVLFTTDSRIKFLRRSASTSMIRYSEMLPESRKAWSAAVEIESSETKRTIESVAGPATEVWHKTAKAMVAKTCEKRGLVNCALTSKLT